MSGLMNAALQAEVRSRLQLVEAGAAAVAGAALASALDRQAAALAGGSSSDGDKEQQQATESDATDVSITNSA